MGFVAMNISGLNNIFVFFPIQKSTNDDNNFLNRINNVHYYNQKVYVN